MNALRGPDLALLFRLTAFSPPKRGSLSPALLKSVIALTVMLGGVIFVDAALDASSFATKMNLTAGTSPEAVAIGDLDGDSKPDLVVVNQGSSSVSIFLNTGSNPSTLAFSSKQDITIGGSSMTAVRLGDIDGDGKLDILVTSYGGSAISILRNTTSVPGAISFAAKQDISSGSGPYSFALADLDNDGKLDIVVASAGTSKVGVLRNNRSTTGIISFDPLVAFTAGSTPTGVVIADFDGDGKADIAACNYGSGSVTVLRNTSTSGSFTASSFTVASTLTTASQPLRIAAADMDGDGAVDLVVAPWSLSNGIQIFRNLSAPGNMAFGSVFTKAIPGTLGTSTFSFAIADVDNDAKADIVASFASNVGVFRNTSTSGSFSFDDPVSYSVDNNSASTNIRGNGVAIEDLNLDGSPDLAAANFNDGTVSILKNNHSINTSPSISAISTKTIGPSASTTGPIAFTVQDAESSLSSLVVTAVSSNPVLVPNSPSHLLIGGSAGNRTIEVLPTSGQSGTATINLMVSDGLLTASTSFTVTVVAMGGSYIQDFNSNPGTSAGFFGSAKWVSSGGVGGTGYISLTDGLNDQRGVLVLPDFTSGRTIDNFIANFKLRIGGGTSPSIADGVSFNFVPPGEDLLTGGGRNFLEDGALTGLSVCFDTFDNGGNEAPAINVTINGVSVAQSQVWFSGSSGHPIFQDSGGQDVSLETGSSFADVMIKVQQGLLTLKFKGLTILDSLPIPGFVPMSGRFAIGGRTGGLNTDHWIDDLSITVSPTPPTISTPGGVSGVAGAPIIGPVPFIIGDAESSPDQLQVTAAIAATSQNPALIANLALAGTGNARTVTMVPVAGQSGSADIVLTVTDPEGLSTSSTFTVTVPVARRLFTATLNGASEVPGNASTAAGFAKVVLDGQTIQCEVILTGISGTPTAVQIHGPALPGQTAPDIMTLAPDTAVPGRYFGVATYLTTQVADLFNGQQYVNVHTAAFPDGEIRGQLLLEINGQPEISQISDQTIVAGVTPSQISFNIDDFETPADQLVITEFTSNASLVPLGGIVVDGQSNSKTLTITPTPGMIGLANITITVADQGGKSASRTFSFRVIPDLKFFNATLAPISGVNSSGQGTAAFALDGNSLRYLINFNGLVGKLTGASILGSGGVVKPLSLNGDFFQTGLIFGSIDYSSTEISQLLNGQQELILFTSGFSGGEVKGTIALAGNSPGDLPPSVSVIPDQAISNNSITTLPFFAADLETAADNLVIHAHSDNPSLIPPSAIQISSTGNARVLSIAPAAGQTGIAAVTLEVVDNAGQITSRMVHLRVISPLIFFGAPLASTDGTATSTSGLGKFVLDGLTLRYDIQFSLTGKLAGAEIQGTTAAPLTLPLSIEGAPPFNGRFFGTVLLDSPTISRLMAGELSLVLKSEDQTANDAKGTIQRLPIAPFFDEAPIISPISNQRAFIGGTLSVPVRIGDLETPADQLKLSVSSSVDDSGNSFNGVDIGGSGEERIVTIHAGQAGTLFIILQAEDYTGNSQFATMQVRVSAATDFFSAELASATGITSSAHGHADLVLDGSALRYDIQLTGLTTRVVRATIESPSSSGGTPIIVDVPLDEDSALQGRIFGEIPYDDALKTQLLAGVQSLVITTEAVPGGELSGIIAPLVNPPFNDASPILFFNHQQRTFVNVEKVVSVRVGDLETPAEQLELTAHSLNPQLVQDGDITVTSAGPIRTVSIKPVPNQIGTAMVQLDLKDISGNIISGFVNLRITSPLDFFEVQLAPSQSAPAPSPSGTDLKSGTGSLVLGDDTLRYDINYTGLSSPLVDVQLRGSGSPAILAHLPVQGNIFAKSGRLFGSIPWTTELKNQLLQGQVSLVLVTEDSHDGEFSGAAQHLASPPSQDDPPIISQISPQRTFVNKTISIPFQVGDLETPAGQLALSSHSSLPPLVPSENIQIVESGSGKALEITPSPNQTGSATIMIEAKDGSGNVASMSFELRVSPALQFFSANLSAAGETPATPSPGHAAAKFALDQNTLRYDIEFDQLTSPLANIRIFGPPLSGTSVPFEVPLPNTQGGNAGRLVGMAFLTPEQASLLASGNGFLDFQTQAFPGGEIRGAIAAITPAGDDAPFVSQVPSYTTVADDQQPSLPLIVGDLVTPIEDLQIEAHSDNPILVSNGKIFIEGSGNGRQIVVQPSAGQTGDATIAINVTDSAGNTATSSFVVHVIENAIVTFGDLHLNDIMHIRFGIGSEPLKTRNLLNLTDLSVVSQEIAAIDGLQAALNLKELLLGDNNISDVSPLSSLRTLKRLSLTGNAITDISSLNGLSQLQDLSLKGNQITDYSAVANLHALTQLSMGHNKITTVAPVIGLTQLESLDLSFNPIASYAGLEQLIHLRDLHLDDTGIASVSNLSPLTQLSSLTLRNNEVTDISTLVNLPNLAYLDLRDNRLDVSAGSVALGIITALQNGGTTVDYLPQKNFAPVSVQDALQATEDTPLVIDSSVLLNNDLSGPEFETGQILTLTEVSASSTSGGTVTLADGKITYHPPLNFSGTDSFSYTIQDNGTSAGNADPLTEVGTVTVNIAAVNDPPVLSPITDRTIAEGSTLTLAAVASDIDSPANALTFSLGPNAPSGASINPTTGVFTWTPSESQGPGTAQITIIVNDNGTPSLTASQTFNVLVSEVNSEPFISSIGTQSVTEGNTLSLNVIAGDSDIPSQILRYSLGSGAPSGASIDPNSGRFTWTPSEAQGPGTYNITVQVDDDGSPNLTAVSSFTVNVAEQNASPVIASIDPRSITEGQTLTVNVSASDPDIPANSLTYSLGSGAPSGTSINPTTGVFTWTPTEEQGPGNYSILVRVTDNGSPSATASQAFSVTVDENNSTPVLSSIGDQSVDEGKLLTFKVSATDPDIPAQTMRYALAAGAPDGASIDPASGVFTWTPTEAQGPSKASITVQVTDNGNPAATASQSFTVTVNEINTPPTLSEITDQSVKAGNLLTVTASATDTDLPANTLTFSLGAGAPAGASINPATGVFTWTPAPQQGASTNTVTVQVSDGAPNSTATRSFKVVVLPSNTAPVFSAVPNQNIPEGIPFSLKLSATDSDIPANVLTFAAIGNVPSGLNIEPGTGVLSWTPTEAQGPSTNQFAIRVTDNGVPSLSATQNVVIVVTEVNVPPQLAAIPDKTVKAGETVTVTATATDADLPANTLSYTLGAGAPAGAAINSTNGIFTWVTTTDLGGSTNAITVQVSDNATPPATASQTFKVITTPSNTAPVLDPIPDQTIPEKAPFTFQVKAVDKDIPANLLSYSVLGTAPAGLALSSAGVITWTPAENQGPSTNQFAIRVSDNGVPSMSATQSMTIVVLEQNDPPVFDQIEPQTVDEGKTLSLTLKATDPDNPPNTFVFSLSPTAPSGMTLNPATGELKWTPTEAQGPSTNRVTVTVTDNGTPPAKTNQIIVIAVREVNLPPSLVALPDQVLSVGDKLTLVASATDPDRPANALSFSLEAGAPAGVAINPATGELTWSPTAVQAPNTNRITVKVTDNGTPPLSDSKAFTAVVRNQPNQPPAISSISNQTTKDSTPTAAILFIISDPDTPIENLSVTAESSNPTVVPVSNIAFAGSGTNRTVTVTPALNQVGTSKITLTVKESTGGKASSAFDLTVIAVAPSITRQPENKNAIAGAQVIFSATATGSLPLGYQWLFNGAAVAGATNPVLTISSVSAGAAGAYSLQVSNVAGKVTSSEATLGVNVPLRVTQQPIGGTVLPGTDVSLAVVAVGKTPLSFQWRFNGVAIDGAKGGTLALSAVQAKDVGDYDVVVSDATGSVTSEAAHLVINAPVTISQQPASQSTAPGKDVQFSVQVSGTPPVQFQWQHNGFDIPGQTNAALALSNLLPADGGDYTVIVANSAGSIVSAPARLTLAAPPVITRQPQGQTNLLASTAAFGVAVTGTEPLSYQWSFNGAIIPSATGPVLTLNNVQAANEGAYSVVVTNLAGTVTSETVNLVVSQPVVISTQPKDQTVALGGVASFSVVASGSQPIAYQWRLNGVDLPGANQANLTVPNVQAVNQGSYQVEVRNASGPVMSAAAKLVVNSPVTIVAQPESLTLTNGAAAKFSVGVVGTGPLSYQWQFNGANIGGATAPEFTIPSVQVANSGNYSVMVSNVVGQVASAPASLKVIIPPSIQTHPVSQNVQPGTPVTFTVVASGDQPLKYQWQLNGINIPGATDSSYSVPSPQPGDAGSYTVVVENPGGAATSNPATLSLILPLITLGSGADTSTPIEVPEGSFDGGSNSLSPAPFGRRSTAPIAGDSRWFSWKAPASGIVTFTTGGSSFDTLMTVYTGTRDTLTQIGSDDDRGGFFSSQVSFNAVQGTTYSINIQGFGGAVGRITVSFKLTQTALKLPVIKTQPQSQTVQAGALVIFTVDADGTALSYQWLFDGAPIVGAADKSLVLSGVQEKDAGKYSVKVTSGTGQDALTVESLTANLQFGPANTAAWDKFKNAPGLGGTSGLQTLDLNSTPIKNGSGSVARGFSGAQVFNTFGSTKEQGEPNLCGVLGGASQWFNYQAPANGVLKVSTEGSNFDTILGVYSGPGTDFESLKLEGCDNNSGADGKTSLVIVSVTAGTLYYVAVDGVNGAVGTVKMGYEFAQGPMIVQGPVSQAVALGADVSLSVKTTNNLSQVVAPTSYQWMKDGLRITGETNTILFIPKVQLANVGDYKVIVSNFAGALTSVVAQVAVNVPLTVTTQPQSQTVRAGSRALLSAAFSGTQPITYQWKLNGNDIAGATNVTLEIPTAQSSDAGPYTVSAQNGAGSVQSQAAALTVVQAPAIVSISPSQQASVGDTVTLSVNATGSGTLSYQWRLNGINLPGATQANLVLTKAQPSDAGAYTVAVSNDIDTTISSPTQLTVDVQLAITAAPQSQAVALGSSAFFSVSAVGSGALGYQWKLNGGNISGANGRTLTLSSVQSKDAGQYTVQVQAGAASIESPPAGLTISVAPVITQQPGSLVVFAGTNISFSVTASAGASYQWLHDGQLIPGAINATLNLDNVQVADSGSYSVIISNPVGSVVSDLALLTVQEEFSVIRVENNTFVFRVTVPEGKTAIIQASDDLTTWTDYIPTPVPSGTSEIEDHNAPNFPFRFYRMRFQ